ncbi:MAG TPA: hypothetical protein VK253_01945 [Candidatus Binatia bacterium]|nr:hypothetical protein [Candidatus Binatia bacterium]
MPQVAIEYMIMVPVLILQIFIFPLTASVIMNTYVDNRLTIELQATAGHMGSSIQQLYYAIDHGSISDGSMTITLDTPPLIEGRAYTTTLSNVTDLDTSCQIMNVTLKFIGSKGQTSTVVTLGQNVDWPENLAFNSTAHSPSLVATKTNDSIWLSFGGT